jgi:hypothetical protein
MSIRFVSSTLVALFVAIAVGACSNEGEGQPCSTDNGNNDCDDNLECVPPPSGQSVTDAPEVCCPVPPAQPTTPECSAPTFHLGDGSTAAPETSTSGDASDASSDHVAEGAASEGGAEAATDATSSDATGQ